jgi:ribosomal protein S18 acetylase RimI-like enzyme
VPTELERALAFEASLRTRCAERILPFRFGHAYFNDSYPRVWDLNLLLVEGAHEVDPGELAAEAELLHTDAGHAHRRADVLDDAVGARLERFFHRIGWQVDRGVVMAYRGEGERSADTAAVDEVGRDDLRLFREEIARAEPWATDEEIVREVVDAGALWEQAGRARYFAARVDGAPVAATELYSDGRIAQVEDVATLPAHRGRGHASAVVLRAVEEALAAGHDLVFLTADAADWPKELYTRLGFEEVGGTWSFLRTPARVAPD